MPMSTSVGSVPIPTPVVAHHDPYPQQHQRQPQAPPQSGTAGFLMMDQTHTSQYLHQFASLYPLRAQIEFYFSPQNLANDTFLKSQLNMSDHIGAVPMGVICNFPKVRQIHALLHNMGHLSPHMTPTADPMLVRMALQQSAVVAVSHDGLWISPRDSSWMQSTGTNNYGTSNSQEPRAVMTSSSSSPSSQATASSSLGVPTHPLPPATALSMATPAGTSSTTSHGERNIVIVRDIPPTVPSEEVLQAFRSKDHSIVPQAARPDVGNTWFVTFASEEQAVKALAAAHNATIAGVPVLGRLKSDVRPKQPSHPSDTEGNASVDTSAVSSSNVGINPTLHQPMHMMYPIMLPPGYSMPSIQQPLPYGYGVSPYPMFAPPPQVAGGHNHPMPLPRALQQQHRQQQQQPVHAYGNPDYAPRSMPKNGGYHYGPPRGGNNPPSNVFLHGQKQQLHQNGSRSDQATNRIAGKNSNNNGSNGNINQNANNQNGKKGRRGSSKKYQEKQQQLQQQQQQQQQHTELRIESSDSRDTKGEIKGNLKKKQQQQPQPKQQPQQQQPQQQQPKQQQQLQQSQQQSQQPQSQQRHPPGKRKPNNSKQDSKKIDLGADNFPALGGGSVSTNIQKNNKPGQQPQRLVVTGGYAQALLKKSGPPTATTRIVPSGATASIEIPNTTALDAAMSQLAFSAEHAASKDAYDDW